MNIQRLHYMDNLRALIMLLGVFLHAGLAYSPHMSQMWLTADQVNTPLMDIFISFVHSFRMPLFFLISGFFTAMLIQKRGFVQLAKNRALRILLPFVLFLPLVIAGIIFPLGWALENVEHPSAIMQFIIAMKDTPDAPQAPPGTAHLWFLYYLLWFYLLTWIGHILLPKSWLSKVQQLPSSALFILPLLMTPALLLGQVPFAAPESFLPQFWAILFFGGFFATGMLLYHNSHWLQSFVPHTKWLIFAAVVLFVPFYWLSPEQASFMPVQQSLITTLVLAACLAGLSLSISLIGLNLAQRFLSKRNRLMGFVSDASYWIYIVHFPIVLMIQYVLLDQSGGVLQKYLITCSLTLLICFLSYLILVRWTPIGWMLNGRRAALRVAQ